MSANAPTTSELRYTDKAILNGLRALGPGWHRTQDVARRTGFPMYFVRNALFRLFVVYELLDHEPQHNGHRWRVR